jgi:phage gpG-like protein
MLAATVSIGGVLRRLEDMRRLDRRKVFSSARRPARADQRDHAKRQESPRGRWAALASSTIERRAQTTKRKRTRRLLGRLPSALVMVHDADRLIIRARARWGHVHMTGGRAGKGARIPARQYMWISRQLLRQVRRLFVDAYRRAWLEGR